MEEITSIRPPKDIWVHEKTGKKYRIVGFGIMESTLRPVVSYGPASGPHGEVWVRTCEEFFDGRFRQERPKVRQRLGPSDGDDEGQEL